MKDIDELIAPDCSWQAKRIFWDEDLYELELERIFGGHHPDSVASYAVEQFFDNPTGSLGTLRASGWSHADRAVIVGDITP